MMATNRKLLIERLTESTDSIKDCNCDMDAASWGYEKGVIITGHEAELFINLLKKGDE